MTSRPRRGRRGARRAFPGAVATLAILTVLVWLAALFVPPGVYLTDEDGSPIPGAYTPIKSLLTPAERVE